VVYHATATRDDRLMRRGPYGHGIGAAVAFWLQEGDTYALWILARWIALRTRRLLGGAIRLDRRLVLEEGLVLAGTARGLSFGIRVGAGRLTLDDRRSPPR
jgi:hypothetical protein